MAYPISKAVLDQVLARLTDAADNGADGWNAIYNGLASSYGLAADMAIEFTAADGASPNFAMANVAARDWIKTSGFKFPFMTLFSIRSVNTNLEKYHQFAGSVDVGINVFLSWKVGRVKLDFESLANCVEETAFTLFNQARNAFPADQDWSDEVVYNGDLALTRSRVERGAEFWDQLMSFQAGFDVHQRGEV